MLSIIKYMIVLGLILTSSHHQSNVTNQNSNEEEEVILKECDIIIQTLQTYISTIADTQSDREEKNRAIRMARKLFVESDSTTIQVSSLNKPDYKPELYYVHYFRRLCKLEAYQRVSIEFENCSNNENHELNHLLRGKKIHKVEGADNDYIVDKYYCQKFRGYEYMSDTKPKYSDFTIKKVLIEAKKNYTSSSGKLDYDIKIKKISVEYTFPLHDADEYKD